MEIFRAIYVIFLLIVGVGGIAWSIKDTNDQAFKTKEREWMIRDAKETKGNRK